MMGMLIFASSTSQKTPEISYSQAATIPFDWDTLQSDTVSFQDTLSGEFLHQVKTLEGIPLFYTKDILTGVCFDNKCRPLNLTVYWNITGRYLGFKLPDGEFLSRYDHKPFAAEDYIRLHKLLADPHLPLGNVPFEELIRPSEVPADSLDAVSGATSKDILAYVVEGAAYTTYTMWNIVYGPTQEWVRRLTEQEMTPALLALILKSPSSEDKIWGLGRIDGAKELDTRIENALLEIIGGEDFFAAYSAVDVLTPAHLRSEPLQIRLFFAYETVNYNLGKLIIEKLNEAPKLNAEVVKRSREILDGLNGIQLGYVLDLYRRHAILDMATCQAVAGLMKKNNRFIAEKAYKYLMEVHTDDEAIIRELKKYEQLRKK